MRRSPGPDTAGTTDATARPGGADAVGGPGETKTAVAVAVERLSAGARQWVGASAAYLNSPEALAVLPTTPRTKALLQLALVCRYWEKAAPDEAGLGHVRGVVEEAGRAPDFLPLMAGDPVNARPFQLVWAALAPPGVTGRWRRGALERLTAEGYLAPGRKSPYLHLGTRFYADLAGVDHQLAPYQELYAASVLARADTLPVAALDVCEITDTVFHLSDYGFGDRGLGLEREPWGRAWDVVDRLTGHCVREGEWESAAKLVLAQYCLGMDPLRTPSGAAGIRMLARVQSPLGAIPGKSAARSAPATAPAGQYFRWAYQATLVTALTMLIVNSGRTAGLPPAPTARAADTASVEGAR